MTDPASVPPSSPPPATGAPVTPPNSWDEPRVVVLLIGFCLLLEGGLIYYQAGLQQAITAGITGLAGITLLIMAWLVPLEDEPEGTGVAAPGASLGEPVGQVVEAPMPPPAPPAQRALEPPPEALVLPPVAPPVGVPIGTSVPPTVVVAPPPPPPPPVEVVEKVPEPLPVEEEAPLSWFDRLRTGLRKTREGFVGKLKKLVFGKTVIDDELLDELEGTLFEADIGVKTTSSLLELLHKRVEEQEIKDPDTMYKILREQLKLRLTRFSTEPKMNPDGLTVFLVIGVNGVGKTTTIAKLARRYIKEGKTVVLAAGDTFRAAAIDQLGIWGQRVGAEVIKGNEGGDPGALVFDAIHAAKKRKAHLLIIDTAGRMHVKANLMDELKKVCKIAEKESEGGPHETLLVLDATTGQNAVQQAKLFNEAIPISGLIMTKLDGTAKGGVLFAVEEQIDAPVKFIGVGEKMDDLMSFDPEQFLEALFSEEGKTKESDYRVL